MRHRWYYIGMIVSSLLGYLEWGGNQHTLLLVAECEIFIKFFHDPLSVLHPLVLLPMIGQILLLVGIVRKQGHYVLAWMGMASIGTLLGVMTIIGIVSLNPKIFASTMPFWFVCVSYIIRIKKNSKQQQDNSAPTTFPHET